MHIAVLNVDGLRGWHTDELQRAAARRGHDFSLHAWRDLSDDLATLDTADVVLLRNMGGGTLEQIVFRMDLIGQLRRGGKRVVNPPRAMEIAVDKYLATARMQAADLPVPATMTCQTHDAAMQAYDQLGGDVVVKPLFGSEGRGIERVCCPDEASALFAGLIEQGRIIYQQQFIEHEHRDMRLLVIGDRVVAAMQRIGADWRTNIALGGRGEPIAPAEHDCHLALQAAQTCGAEIAGVDLVHDMNGQSFVLEVNAVPGWRALGSVTGIDVAGEIITYLESNDERPTGHAGVRRGGALAQGG